MIIDFTNTPATGGIPFRSRLEIEVAAELDAHEVEWGYEQPVIFPDGTSPFYLPDFTIHDANEALHLPAWVEVKPQQFLYDLRDTLGVTRRCGDKFKTDVQVTGVDWKRLKETKIEELWKPKRLAETTGEAVMVVGGVGGTSRLSVEMRPYEIVFSREHPFVNWPGHLHKIEVEDRERQWAANRVRYEREEQQRAEARAIADKHEAAQNRQKDADNLRAAKTWPRVGATRYNATCVSCRTGVPAQTGNLYKVGEFSTTWVVVCPKCQAKP